MRVTELCGVDKACLQSDWPPDELDQEISDLLAELRLRQRVPMNGCLCPDNCFCRCGAVGRPTISNGGPDDTARAWGY